MRRKSSGDMVEGVEIVWLVLAVVGVTMVASGVQHIAGMGFGLVAVPVLVSLFGAAQGVLWGNIIGLVTSVAVLVVTWRDVDWGIAIRFILASIPAIALTVYFTKGLDPNALNVVVGCIMLVLVAFTVFSVPIPHANGHGAMYVTGAVGGFLSASVGQSGPVLTAYARAAKWPQRNFVATLQVYFFAMNLLNIPLKLAAGYGPDDPVTGWATFIAGVVGVTIGGRIARHFSSRITAKQARGFAMLVATAGAVLVLTRGLIGILS